MRRVESFLNLHFTTHIPPSQEMRGLLYRLHATGKQRLTFRLKERIDNVRLTIYAPSVCNQCPNVSHSEDSSTYFWIALSTTEIKAALDLIHRQPTFHRLQSIPPARPIEQSQGSRGCLFPTSCAPSRAVLKTVSHRGTSAYLKRACVTLGYGYPNKLTIAPALCLPTT